MIQGLDEYLVDLLHINEARSNKLIDLYAGDLKKTVFLKSPISGVDNLTLTIEIIKKRFGEDGNTLIRNSAKISSKEQRIGNDINSYDWCFADNSVDGKKFNDFVGNVYKELSSKGFNPLFLSIGALKWKILVKDELKIVASPLIILPIKIIRSGQASPLVIEFINDEIYFNPCLLAKLKQVMLPSVCENLPLPNGINNFDDPIPLNTILEIDKYLDIFKKYINSCKQEEDSVFDVQNEVIAISQYNHNEICMYYDIRRNKDKIMNHPLVNEMFTKNDSYILENNMTTHVDLVLPYDSTQEEIIKKVKNGNSIIIKGPPGTGKTLTIANMISALLHENKRILFASKKISALTEVYAKLPKELQKFALLLDSETEAQAARTNPTAIKKELNDLLKERKNHIFKKSILFDKESARQEKLVAYRNLNNYYDFMFTNNSLDSSYYDCLDIYFKNENLPTYEFIKKEALSLFNKEHYNSYLSVIKELDGYYDLITNNGNHTFNESVWYGLKDNINLEELYKELQKASNHFRNAINVLDGYDYSIDDISIKYLMWFSKYKLSKEQLEELIEIDLDHDNLNKLNNYITDYLSISNKTIIDINLDINTLITIYTKLNLLSKYGTLDNDKIDLIYSYNYLFAENNQNHLSLESIKEILNTLDIINDLNIEKNKYLYDAYKIYKKDLNNHEINLIKKGNKKLTPYILDRSKKLGIFAFGVKSIYKKLCKLSYLSDCSFEEIVEATDKYNKSIKLEETINLRIKELYRLVQKQLTNDEIRCLYEVLNTCRCNDFNLKELVNDIYNNYNDINSYAKLVKMDTYNIKTLIDTYKHVIAYQKIKEIIKGLCSKLSFSIENHINFSMTLIALMNIKNIINDTDELTQLQNITNNYVNDEMFNGLFIMYSLSDLFEDNLYINNLEMMKYANLKLYYNEIIDRNIYGAYLSYNKLLDQYSNSNFDIKMIFNDFENGKINPYSFGLTNKFEAIFEHSFYYLLIKSKIEELNNRNTFIQDTKNSLEKISELETTIAKNQAAVIESRLFTRIDVDDIDFAFLGINKDNRSLRTLFKNNASAILKLKKCFILSPSTASLLFRPDDYDSFDIVIIDEASQLEPVNMIPVLFRSKQCVIVGDEWQMPPIEHFKSKNDKLIDNYDEHLKKADSALSLALESNQFKYYELSCHYRSETESLIKFSQKEFYPNMRTFPAPTPKREGLGITDIYIENAISEGGINNLEALEVVKQIKKHMDCYYDDNTKELKRSFGVIAFGLKQIEYIESLVKKDKELSMKIDMALGKFDDVKEKLVFFKTIETVQGQETDHVILSLTYGIDKNGNPVQRFGELNRDDLGKCIFNVAVTRAKEEITVIHSLEPEQIYNPRIKYIADYLYITRYFNKTGHDQFISVTPNDGFIKSVGNYIESLGISSQRIVYDYGVTDGSIRIPIVILSEDLNSAKCAIWAEKQYPGDKFIDINCKYYNVLIRNGWKFHNIYAHSWYDNNLAEKRILKEYIYEHLKEV